jgi:hypothetical protein
LTVKENGGKVMVTTKSGTNIRIREGEVGGTEMNDTFAPFERQLGYITLYGIVRAMLQHNDDDEIINVCEDIAHTADWTVDGDSMHTLISTGDVLAGIRRWADKHPQSVLFNDLLVRAVEAYGIDKHYAVDIQSTF